MEPGEVLVAVDTRLGRAAGVDPGDAMKVRIADGGIRAIGKQLAVYDAFEIGAFVCGPALFDAVEMAVAAGDSSLAGAIQVLADSGVARALTIGDEEWWFDVDTPRDYRNGSRYVLRGTGKPLDGAIAARLNRTALAAGGHTRAARPLPAHHTEPGHAHRLCRRRGGGRLLRGGGSDRRGPARRAGQRASTAAMARSPGSPIGRPRTARSSTPCSTGRPTAFCSPARRSTSPLTPTWALCSAAPRCLSSLR